MTKPKSSAEVVLPPIPKALLDYLKQLYPDTCPPLTMSLEDIRTRSAQVAVWKHLESIYEASK